MKKFIFMLVAMMTMFSVTMSAQKALETSKFTDNMSITLQGGVVTPFSHFFTDGTTTPTVVLGVDKFVTPWLGFGIEGRTTIGVGDDYNIHTAFDQVNVSGNLKINVLNLFNFNGTKRVFEPVVYTGLGWGHVCCSDAMTLSDNYALNTVHMNVNGTNMAFGIPSEYLGWMRNYLTYRAGVELNFNLGKAKAWTIVVNPSVVWGNIDNGRLDKANGNFECTAGIKYNFKNANGTRTFKVWNITALNDEINDLRAENEALKNRKPEVIEKVIVKEKSVKNQISVPFECNSSELTAAAKQILDQIESGSEVAIVGTASPEGTAERNAVLSKERALTVSEYLSSKGVKVTSAKGDEAGRLAIITIQ